MNLNEYKELYRNNMINNPSLNKNDYIFKYVETNDERYLSGAIYKFWYILSGKSFIHKNNMFITQEELYEIFIDSILETCEKKLWLDAVSSLFNDKKAPEKSINTIFRSKILNKYYENNRQKRKINYNTIEYKANSLEKSYNSLKLNNNEILNKIIVDFFDKKDYYASYILDLIINDEVFDSEKFNFDRKKLKHLLMTLSDDYYDYFSNYYNIDKNKVDFSKKYMTQSYSDMDKKINKTLNSLLKNEIVKQIVKGSD